METFKASSQGFDAFVSLSKGEDIKKDQFLEKIDGMYPKMAKHVKSQWKRLGCEIFVLFLLSFSQHERKIC